MREVAARAACAAVTGSRRNRWQATQIVDAPPASAALACSTNSASGARPSDATPVSLCGIETIALLQRTHGGIDAAFDLRRRAEVALGRRDVLQAGGRQQRHHGV